MATNNKFLIFLALAGFMAMAGCNKNYLEKSPQDKLTEATTFQTYQGFKTYAWGFYDIFEGYNNNSADNNIDILKGDIYSDNMAYTAAGNENPWAYQLMIVPPSGGDWDFSFIRNVNILLDNVDKSPLTQEDKDHWRSVGLLFRSFRYLQMLSEFGDVPWLEHVVQTDSTNIIYGTRTARDTVAANILRDLQWAELHIEENNDGANTVNVNVVQAVISRFGLFEGTWRKYHGLQNATPYLQASRDASLKLINDFPTIHANYDELFNSESLAGVEGLILYKVYANGLRYHSLDRYLRTAAWFVDMAKDGVQSYLCSDGKPISTSALYAGDTSMYNEFRNRDHRLYYTVEPPYKVTIANGATTWAYTGVPEEQEYVDIMATISSPGFKTLPTSRWNGQYLKQAPHFREFNNGQVWSPSELGYFMYKYYNTTTDCSGPVNTTDAPIFRVEEAMLNYAEAEWELGEFSQSTADMTINPLRVRAGVQPMTVSAIDASFDTNRDPEVDPILWEIRRERRVEFMGEGFRFDDLRRWKKCTYLNKQQLGVFVNNDDYGDALTIHGGGTEGYVEFFGPPPGWLEYYYLYPIPKDQLVLNPNIKQNPGWPQ
jgi:hypothetical protein